MGFAVAGALTYILTAHEGGVRRKAVSATTFEQWVSCCTQSSQKSITGREGTVGSQALRRGGLITWKKLWWGPSQWIGGRMMAAEVAMKAVDGSSRALWDTIRSLDLPKEKGHLWRDFSRGVGCFEKIPFANQDNQLGWREEGGRRWAKKLWQWSEQRWGEHVSDSQQWGCHETKRWDMV